MNHEPGDIIYIEDGEEFVGSNKIIPALERTSGRSVLWDTNTDTILASILFDEYSIEQCRETIREINSDNSDGKLGESCSPELINQLASFIDPQKIAHRVFISDNETNGALAGAHFLEAINVASNSLDTDERPQIFALMSSNIDTIYRRDHERIKLWQERGIDAIDKFDYPLAVAWAAQRIGQDPELSFADFFERITSGLDYIQRTYSIERRKPVYSAFFDIVELFAWGDVPEEHYGLLSRIPFDELQSLYNCALNGEGTLDFIQEIGARYPREGNTSLGPETL